MASVTKGWFGNDNGNNSDPEAREQLISTSLENRRKISRAEEAKNSVLAKTDVAGVGCVMLRWCFFVSLLTNLLRIFYISCLSTVILYPEIGRLISDGAAQISCWCSEYLKFREGSATKAGRALDQFASIWSIIVLITTNSGWLYHGVLLLSDDGVQRVHNG